MRRSLVLVSCVAALAAGACASGSDEPTAATVAPTSTSSTIPVAQLRSRASEINDLLIAAQWDSVVEGFTAEMRAGLTADGLKTAWEQVVATYGAYRTRGISDRSLTAAQQGTVVFDTPMTFGTTSLKSRIAFDADGRIDGLLILKANVP